MSLIAMPDPMDEGSPKDEAAGGQDAAPKVPVPLDGLQNTLPTKEQIDAMSVGQLKDMLRMCGRLSDVVLQVSAWAWAALEEKGVDLSEFIDECPYLFRRVRDIAHERLSVDAAMKFGGKSYLLDFVRKQPREVQDRLARDDRVPFVVKDEETKELTVRNLHLTALEREQLKQLVDDRGEVRTVNQQIAYLSPSPAPPVEREAPRARVHIVRGKLRTDGEVPVDVVIRALKAKGFLPVGVVE